MWPHPEIINDFNNLKNHRHIQEDYSYPLKYLESVKKQKQERFAKSAEFCITKQQEIEALKGGQQFLFTTLQNGDIFRDPTNAYVSFEKKGFDLNSSKKRKDFIVDFEKTRKKTTINAFPPPLPLVLQPVYTRVLKEVITKPSSLEEALRKQNSENRQMDKDLMDMFWAKQSEYMNKEDSNMSFMDMEANSDHYMSDEEEGDVSSEEDELQRKKTYGTLEIDSNVIL